MERTPAILLRSFWGFPEGTKCTLLTYKDGMQALHITGANSRAKVRPEDRGTLYQTEDYGIPLPIRRPLEVDGKYIVLQRMLTPKGKASIHYYRAVASDTSLREAAEKLELVKNDTVTTSGRSKGYRWEDAILFYIRG